MGNYNNNMLAYISAPKFDWPDLLRNILKFEFQQKHSRQNAIDLVWGVLSMLIPLITSFCQVF